MTRTDQDSWDLASSVGATATMVAAARAVASGQSNAIINDPFAAPLVRAVGLDFFRRLVDGDIEPAEVYDGSGKDMALETDSIAVRTLFFDDFFRNAARDGKNRRRSGCAPQSNRSRAPCLCRCHRRPRLVRYRRRPGGGRNQARPLVPMA